MNKNSLINIVFFFPFTVWKLLYDTTTSRLIPCSLFSTPRLALFVHILMTAILSSENQFLSMREVYQLVLASWHSALNEFIFNWPPQTFTDSRCLITALQAPKGLVPMAVVWKLLLQETATGWQDFCVQVCLLRQPELRCNSCSWVES